MKRFKVRQIYLLFILILSGFLITGCGGSGGVTETGHWLPKDVVSIEVTPPNPIIATATTQQFMATGIYAENAHFDLTSSVTWSSSNTNVATISNLTGSKGLASALTAGITTIKATDTATGIFGTATLTVKSTSVTLTSIEVTPVNPSIALGTNQPFIATGIYSDATTQNLTSSVTWTSSNTGIATIDTATNSVTKGLATSKAIGATTITATDTATGKSGYTTLTVTAARLVSIRVTPANPSIALGTNQQFIATGIYTDLSQQVLTSSVTWTSSNTGIATINTVTGSIDKGLATSIAIGGPITITAASGTISGTTNLTVTAVTLLSIAVTPPDAWIALGTKQQFIAMGTYSDGTTQNLTSSVTWSTPLLTTPVASISNAADGSNGLATSLNVGGPITITAASGTISGTAHLTVTAARLVSIAVTPPNPSVALGTNQQFIATGTYTNATTQVLTSSVTWTSETTTVAAIDTAPGSVTKGLATSLAIGTTKITATFPGPNVFSPISGNTTLTVIAAAPPSVNLGRATTFGIAATKGVTNTPLAPITKINGNVVLDPLAQCNAVEVDAFGGFGLCDGKAPTINGTVISHEFSTGVTPAAIRADLLAAFLSITPPAGPPAAGSLGGATNIPAGTTLGNTTGTALVEGDNLFYPGVYQSLTSIMITGDLTLDAKGDPNARFVFQSSSTVGTADGNTGAHTRILLINGAKASNVWWQAGSDATLGTSSEFQGNILASRDITMKTSATSCGRLLAGAFTDGAFVFDSNVVSVPGHTMAPADCK